MNKNTKIKNIKLQIKKLQKELKLLESNGKNKRFEIHWTDMKYINCTLFYNPKHITVVTANDEAEAKKIFKSKQLHYVKWDAEQGCGAWNEVVPYNINKVVVK